jgi:acyl-CoA thioesterase I
MWPVLPALLLLQPVPAPRTLAFLGDSLTAGYGLAPEEAFPSLIEARLRARGLPWRVVNAGVSGDTSAGALRRLDWLFRGRVDVLFVCLGANDGLRGIPIAETERNLRTIVAKARAQGASVVLAGMMLPENYGTEYRRGFEAMYARLARELKLPFLPFLLKDVAMEPGLNQHDGIHPNAAGSRKVADTVWKALEPVLAAKR